MQGSRAGMCLRHWRFWVECVEDVRVGFSDEEYGPEHYFVYPKTFTKNLGTGGCPERRSKKRRGLLKLRRKAKGKEDMMQRS